MSYILDALKKAERERGMTKVPTISTVHDSDEKPSPRIRSLSIAVLVLLTAGLVSLLLLWDRDKEPADSARNYVEQGDRPDLQASEIAESSSEIPRTPYSGLNQRNTSRLTDSEPSTMQPSGTEKPDPEIAASSASLNPPDTSRIRGKTAPSGPTRTRRIRQQESPEDVREDPEENYPGTSFMSSGDTDVSDYPARSSAKSDRESLLRQAMETMNISVLLYAEIPSERLVFIDGRKYAEGDSVDGRFLVKSIMPDGVILSYEDAQALLKPRTD